MPAVDLNCDLGEGADHDGELMPLVTSANVACGGHAGDRASMRSAIELALASGVAIGAHPSLADREGFGRRELPITPLAAAALVEAQVGELLQLALEQRTRLSHVKPHGALYNLAARDFALADAIAAAVRALDPQLVLFGLAGSELLRAGRARGLRVASEVFADRTYQADGSLTPRAQPGALIASEAEAVAQVLRMVQEGIVRAADGTDVLVAADTVCVHGDGPRAVAFAWRLRADLAAAGVDVRPFAAA
jgi:UPF0271 protein